MPLPVPPTNASVTQVAEFVSRYHEPILLMAWLQGTSSLFVLVFVLALVRLAGATNSFAGWMTMHAALFLGAGGLLILLAV